MKVTIIIPNYNGKHFMEPCLASLKEQTFRDFKILVVTMLLLMEVSHI